MYALKEFTYGAELELADVLYGQKLPYGCLWNTKERTIVNSNGVAQSPGGRYWPYGGEINTRPTKTLSEQVALIGEIYNCLNPVPTINFTCALHIHIGVPGLRDDLAALKRIANYVYLHVPMACKITNTISCPDSEGGKKWYRGYRLRNLDNFNLEQLSNMNKAVTTEEFYIAHFQRFSKKTGQPLKYLQRRCAVNMRSLWENNGTIEFRHFSASLKLMEIRCAFEWCKEFLHAAVNNTDISPNEILELIEPPVQFPPSQPYEVGLDRIYNLTCYKHTPDVIRSNLAELRLIE
ncbi:MAG TPA: amidoligase family protein [Dehalococcoidia bacterium]